MVGWWVRKEIGKERRREKKPKKTRYPFQNLGFPKHPLKKSWMGDDDKYVVTYCIPCHPTDNAPIKPREMPTNRGIVSTSVVFEKRDK